MPQEARCPHPSPRPQVRTAGEEPWAPGYDGAFCPVLWDNALAVKIKVTSAECDSVEEAVGAGGVLGCWCWVAVAEGGCRAGCLCVWGGERVVGGWVGVCVWMGAN